MQTHIVGVSSGSDLATGLDVRDIAANEALVKLAGACKRMVGKGERKLQIEFEGLAMCS